MSKKKKAKRAKSCYEFPPYGPYQGYGPGPGGVCPPWGPNGTPNARRLAEMAAMGKHPGHPHWAGMYNQNDWVHGWLDFQNPAYLKGLIIGALGAAVVSNPTAQKKTMESVAHLWGLLQGGFEEVKERFRDVEAEMQATARSASVPDDDAVPAPGKPPKS